MPTAVIRVVVDPTGLLCDDDYRGGLRRLRARGLDVVAAPNLSVDPHRHEIELIVDDGHRSTTDGYLAECRTAFGVEPVLGVITYVSRGTEDDARGVLARFGVSGTVARTIENSEEVFTVSLSVDTSRRVAESHLHTALEAALNAEVRIVTAS
ncbi:hypothetical protein [Rhodococcus qingshengii]|uniref:hypothetical protein n=1 Tax=Rhodococcus qingshengii TaxID=334542 RepID=UPI001BE90A2B|nr:hypothetical protein [Rhodococcus qingshengii]MBT2275665.1 hypothetical protein [Rhodococcus qingshengii]